MLKKVPHTYVIIFGLIVFCAVLTWVIPGGEFKRETVVVNDIPREVIISQSFEFIESNAQTWQIFSAFFDGFVNTANIIAFILMIGGAFWVLNESKAIDIGIYTFLQFSKNWENSKILRKIGVNNIILTGIMLIFSLFGAVFGMSEETIAFTIIFVPLAISMGYDSIVGVSLCFVAAALGFAGAFLNPFTVGIAQGLSNLPLFSGIEYRIFMWSVISALGFVFILRYASKIHKHPEKSLVYEEDQYWRSRNSETSMKFNFIVPRIAWISFGLLSLALILFSVFYPVTDLKIGNSVLRFPAVPGSTAIFILAGIRSLRKTVHYYILNLLTFTIVFLIVGVMGYNWYVMEIATLFLALGILSGSAIGKTANEITKSFIEGAKDILPAALVVGLAGGIIVILKDGKIMDTILFYASQSMSDLGKVGSISMMYLIQTFLNIFIPSGSGKAALTMPMMSQFSDLIGISRQATVIAFQLGDGFTNLITPTSGVLIGVLGIARIPYEKWFKWVAPFILILIVLGFLLLLPTVLINLNGF
ncbi:MAG: C4-dicarboxylate anaerobic [Prolixibacteraceae bacterium]|nr:MAG: C4-dicarboxylate anaerobic [Prolixibacteraceae bacterium]